MIVVGIPYFIHSRMIWMSDCFPIVVDIETANLGPGKPGQRVNPNDWEIACIGVFDSLSKERYVFIPFDKINRYEGCPEVNSYLFNDLQRSLLKATTADYVLPLTQFLHSLNHWASTGRYFLTHRGHNFDWPILSHHLGFSFLYDSLNLKGRLLDTHAYIEQQTGHNCGLNSLITACLGESEEKILKGKDAPRIWQQGIAEYQQNFRLENLALVIDYCLGDVVKTYGVFSYGLENDSIEVVPYGVESTVSVPIESWGVNL